MDTTLPPYAEEWLQFEQRTNGRMTLQGSHREMRQQFDAFFEKLKPTLPTIDGVLSKVYDTDVGVRVKVYKPEDMTGVKLVGLYIHSGAWVMGSVEHEDNVCRTLASRLPAGIVSVDYRLAPEHPYPAGLADCCKIWQWMHTTSIPRFFAPSGLAVPRNLRTFLIGASAGGNLALSLALRTVSSTSSNSPDTTFPPPNAIFALSPTTIHHTALDLVPEKYRHYWRPERYADAAILTRECVNKCQDIYTGSGSESNSSKNPFVSVLLHPSLKLLPNVYLTTSDKDPMADESLMLRDALINSHSSPSGDVGNSKKVVLKMYEGYPHCFHLVPGLGKTNVYYDDLIKAIKEMCV